MSSTSQPKAKVATKATTAAAKTKTPATPPASPTTAVTTSAASVPATATTPAAATTSPPTPTPTPTPSPIVHILRHGEAYHNLNIQVRDMRLPDPPLTTFGISQAANINLPAAPDLIVISPMRRTIQTAIHAFNLHADKMPFTPAVQIWPDLLGAGRRMFHLWATIDAGGGMENDTTACATITTSDMGSTMTTPADAAAIAATPRAVVRAELEAGYPQFDFSLCDDEWEYPRYTPVETEARAARVRKRLATMAEECGYQNIYVVTHGGFAKDLAQSDTKPRNGECRRYELVGTYDGDGEEGYILVPADTDSSDAASDKDVSSV